MSLDYFDACEPERCTVCQTDCLTLEPERYAHVKITIYGERLCPDCQQEPEPKPEPRTAFGRGLFLAFSRRTA